MELPWKLAQKLMPITIMSPASDYSYALSYALIVFCSLLLPSLILLLCVSGSTFQLFRRGGRLRLPPGPRGLPLIGHLHLLGTNPHHSLSELSKRYGPFMYRRFGSVPVVVASSPGAARLILQTHDQTLAGRPQKNAVPMQVVGCKDVAFSQPGPYWKLIRQLFVTDLFGSKRLEAIQPLIAEETHALLLSILYTADCDIPMRTKLYQANCNIISRMAIGRRLQQAADHQEQDQLHSKHSTKLAAADPSDNLVALSLEFNRLLGVFNVGDYIPLLSWMDLQGCMRQSKVVGQKIRAVWQEIIDARRNARLAAICAHEDVDFLDALLSASTAGRTDAQITDLNIMAILTDMFAAGIDSSAVTMEWAFSELLRHPPIMRKVQDELEEVVGSSRLVQPPDISHLPYLRAVVKETLRLHPVGPLLMPHRASQSCQISGFDIPSNTLAYVNVWAIGRDPTIWERPLEFSPERFLGSNIDIRGQHFELLPFGSGRRTCPGMLLALNIVHLMLASLLHAFAWTTSGEVDMSEEFGLVMTLAKPLVLKAMLKVPRHFIETQN